MCCRPPNSYMQPFFAYHILYTIYKYICICICIYTVYTRYYIPNKESCGGRACCLSSGGSFDLWAGFCSLAKGPKRPHKHKAPCLVYSILYIEYIWYIVHGMQYVVYSIWYINISTLQTMDSGIPLILGLKAGM